MNKAEGNLFKNKTKDKFSTITPDTKKDNWESNQRQLPSLILNHKSTLIVCSLIIGLSIALSNGIFIYERANTGVVHKYNKFTGAMSLCHVGINDKLGKCQKIGN
jgi:hypothetical protein